MSEEEEEEEPICPEEVGVAPTEYTSMKTSTPSVILDLCGENGGGGSESVYL